VFVNNYDVEQSTRDCTPFRDCRRNREDVMSLAQQRTVGSKIAALQRKLLRTVSGLMLLAMPIGYVADDPDSANTYIGVHGGAGQAMSIVRGCGGVSSSEKYSFYEAAGSLLHSKRSWTVGVRGGMLDISGQRQYQYFNPHVGYETRYFGLNMGYVVGNVAWSLSSIIDASEDSDPINFSGHLRLGHERYAHLIISLAESTPLYSSGGPFVIGLGYSPHSSIRLLSGISAGFYDGVGFTQQILVSADDHLAVQLSGRIGSAEGDTEAGLSAGLIFKIAP